MSKLPDWEEWNSSNQSSQSDVGYQTFPKTKSDKIEYSEINRKFMDSYPTRESKDIHSSKSFTNRTSSREPRLNPASTNQIPEVDFIDLFECRACFLNSAEVLQSVNDSLIKMKNYVHQEADFDIKDIISLLTPIKLKNDIPYYKKVPKEAYLLQTSTSKLYENLLESITAISECFINRKTIYLKELKKLREVSNQATRNAIQVERCESVIHFNKLKGEAECKLQNETEKRLLEIKQMNEKCFNLENVIQNIQKELKTYMEKDQNRLELQSKAIAEAIKEQKLECEKEISRSKDYFSRENERLILELQKQKDYYEVSLQKSINEIKGSENEKRELIAQEKLKLEEELIYLRNENSKLVISNANIKETSLKAARDEREQVEKLMQDQLGQSLQNQAQLKAQMAEAIKKVQEEDIKRRNEYENQLNAQRNKLVTSHALEIEKLHDKHRSEIKRLQAELEVHYQESLIKVKHMHEQELNRQIRENDKLTRLVARQGGPTLFENLPNENTSFRDQKPSYYTSSLTPRHSSSRQNTIDPSSPPPPPPPFSNNFDSSDRQIKNKLNWGKLNDSLRFQDSKSNVFSYSNPLPATFPLDEALEKAKVGKRNPESYNIGANSRRASGYLRDLDKYLKGNENIDMYNHNKVDDSAVETDSLEDRVQKISANNFNNHFGSINESSLSDDKKLAVDLSDITMIGKK